jgi:hypothetical protein
VKNRESGMEGGELVTHNIHYLLLIIYPQRKTSILGTRSRMITSGEAASESDLFPIVKFDLQVLKIAKDF